MAPQNGPWSKENLKKKKDAFSPGTIPSLPSIPSLTELPMQMMALCLPY